MAWVLPSAANLSKYPEAARQLLTGRMSAERLADFSPFYLAAGIALVHVPGSTMITLIWLQTVLVAITAFLLFLVVERSFSLLFAWIGIALFALNKSVLLYEQVAEPEVFLVMFLVAALYWLGKPGARAALAAGVCFALAITCRPNLVPAGLLVPVFFALQQMRPLRRWIARSAVFLGPLVLAVGTLFVFGLMPCMNPGTVFFEGNNPNSYGTTGIYPPVVNELSEQATYAPDSPHEVYRQLARLDTGRRLTIKQTNAYWIRKTACFISDYPGHFLRNVLNKLVFIYHSYEWHDISNVYLREKVLGASWVPDIPTGLLSALAIAGMVMRLRDWKKDFVLFTVVAIQSTGIMVLYASARQRYVLIPILVYFASAFLQRRPWKEGRVFVALALVLALLFSWPMDVMKDQAHFHENSFQSVIFASTATQDISHGRLRDASGDIALSLAYAPWFRERVRPSNISFMPWSWEHAGYYVCKNKLQPETASGRFDLAVLGIEAGRLQEAHGILTELVDGNYRFKRDFFQPFDPRFYLARIAELEGNRKEAIQRLEASLRTYPGNPHALAHLHALTGEQQYKDLLFRYFDPVDALYYLGRAFLQTGRNEDAVACFTEITRKLPEYRSGQIYLAAALSRAGKPQPAVAAFKRASQLSESPIFFEKEILSAFGSQDAYSYAMVLKRYGHFEEAVQVLSAAIPQPDDSVRKEIAWLGAASKQYSK